MSVDFPAFGNPRPTSRAAAETQLFFAVFAGLHFLGAIADEANRALPSRLVTARHEHAPTVARSASSVAAPRIVRLFEDQRADRDGS